MALACMLDRVHIGDFGAFATPARDRHDCSHPRSRRLQLGAACGLIVVATLVPLSLIPRWPYPVVHVSEPPILRAQVLGPLSQASIVADYPPALVNEDALVWQAEAAMSYELFDGYAIVPGPGGHATEDPPVDALALVFAAGVLGTLKVPATAAMEVAIRRAVVHDHITALIVMPGTTGSVAVAAIFTSTFGRPAQRSDGALLWTLGGRRR
jgi:hypothetical protein